MQVFAGMPSYLHMLLICFFSVVSVVVYSGRVVADCCVWVVVVVVFCVVCVCACPLCD